MTIRSRLADWLFPRKCPFCGALTRKGDAVCDTCRRTLPWTEGQEQCWHEPNCGTCIAPLFYEGAVRKSLLRLKFGGAAGIANALGELLADCAAEHYPGMFNCVTWVPVSSKRKRKRGYDQTELLAKAAGALWDTKPEAFLMKAFDNPPQSKISGGLPARRANVLGVYEVREGVSVEGRRILLLDDIITTGATLAECTRVLREEGAAEVICAALARGSPPNS